MSCIILEADEIFSRISQKLKHLFEDDRSLDLEEFARELVDFGILEPVKMSSWE